MPYSLCASSTPPKARKRFLVALKLDMKKAYDEVRWDFMFAALQTFGFPPYWVISFVNTFPQYLIGFWSNGSQLLLLNLIVVFAKGIPYLHICLSSAWKPCLPCSVSQKDVISFRVFSYPGVLCLFLICSLRTILFFFKCCMLLATRSCMCSLNSVVSRVRLLTTRSLLSN